MKMIDVWVCCVIMVMVGGYVVVLIGDFNGDGYFVFVVQVVMLWLVVFVVWYILGYLCVVLLGVECE